MIRFLPLVVFLCLAGAGCNSEIGRVVGSGVVGSEDRPVREITEIHVNGVGVLVLKQSDHESLTIKADDNILPLLKSDLSGGKLVLGMANNTTIQTSTPIEYIVEVKSISEVRLSGATSAKLTAISGQSFSLKVTGASHATLQGNVDSLTLSASGASNIKAGDLKCKTSKVDASGACNVTVHAEETLDAHASGASHITYLGDPKVKEHTSGASSVKKR